MKPLISVIVPIYNVEKYLKECLLSIQNQTYKHLQIILVDDGATDKSAEIAQKFVKEDSRFQLFKQENKGQSAARNVGMKHATGTYLSFVDADDFLAADFYQTLLTHIENADVVQIGYMRIQENGAILSPRFPRNRYQYVAPWTRLYRSALLQDNNIVFPEGHIYEDVLFSIDLWRVHPKIRQLKYTGYFYRKTPTSTTSKLHKKQVQQLFSLINEKLRQISLCDLPLQWQIRYLRLRLKFHFWFHKC